MSQHPARYYVDGFLLKILDSAYLVQVEPTNGNTGRYVTPAHLPEWIFRSSHAIWLVQDEGSLADRATKGDEIKQRIMSKGAEK
ncbi:hypothetical protein L0222_10090 [bacterium]|nr:hypothetical protein [bacterium]MCI0604614.1 hypothetical protein [bacterium]